MYKKLSVLIPVYNEKNMRSFCEKVKFMGIILDLAGDILRPETRLNCLNKSSMLVMLVLSL